MELLFKPLVLLALFVQPFISCYSQQRDSRNEPITRDLLSNLESGKDYLLELKSGTTLEIYIQQVGPEGISGFSYQYLSSRRLTKLDYFETFERIENNVASVTLLKRVPLIITETFEDPDPIPQQIDYTPEERAKIEKFHKMKMVGTTLTVLGGLVVMVGAISAMSKTDILSGTAPDTHTEEVIVGIGMVAVVPGVPLMCFGIHNERKYKNEAKGTSVRLGLNTKRPGLTLMFQF
jgi:hypothetical protein